MNLKVLSSWLRFHLFDRVSASRCHYWTVCIQHLFTFVFDFLQMFLISRRVGVTRQRAGRDKSRPSIKKWHPMRPIGQWQNWQIHAHLLWLHNGRTQLLLPTLPRSGVCFIWGRGGQGRWTVLWKAIKSLRFWHPQFANSRAAINLIDRWNGTLFHKFKTICFHTFP